MTLENIRIRNGIAALNGRVIAHTHSPDPAEMYRVVSSVYPKFFKMDKLSKWAWLGAEILLRNEKGGWRYDGADKTKIAVVIATSDGCLEADKRYNETRAGIASPALFVYTLPNIMLGEICIRHGFTGEQLCGVQNAFDAEALHFWVVDLLENRGISHCLFGWANAVDGYHDVCFFWVDKHKIDDITPEKLEQIYSIPF